MNRQPFLEPPEGTPSCGVVVCDLDDTLSDTAHREFLLPNWGDFHAACESDPVKEGVLSFVLSLCKEKECSLCVLSARPTTVERKTRGWLKRNHIAADRVILKPSGLRMPTAQWKAHQVSVLEKSYRVVGVVDDSQRVLEAVRRVSGCSLYKVVGQSVVCFD